MHVAIIGAYGSAGVAAAETLAERVDPSDPSAPLDRLTLIDDGDPGGGLCILRGCMPSKAVLSAAEHRYRARHDDRLVGDPPELDLDRVVASKDEHVSSFAAHRRAAVDEIADRPGVRFRHERARFVGLHELALSGGDRLDADYVVVATGSTLNVPDLPGIGEVDYADSAAVLDATELPDSGVVMGFGYVGIELSAYLAEAGVDLTVIEHDERPLDDAPDAFGDELLELYREEFGIEVLTETSERSVEATADGGVRLHTDRDDDRASVEADELFVFTGRRPDLDGLNLAATPLAPGEGWVDATMRAVDDESGRTYVVGDANGRIPLLHVAKEQGYLAADNVLADIADDDLAEYDPITHRVLFSGAAVYPYARVGHTAESAAEAGHDCVEVGRDAADDGVFAVKATPRGLARLVVDADDGTVLGYQGLHLHADAMAKTMQVLVERGADVREVPDRAYHPTTPEILDGLFRAASERLPE
ncbi:NAD(P)/FAD-dependent oxidoreductase [Halobaculum sp. CBA1158]|uniref:dihydrolipoyl dehydrogenase family protein n=1 Tax=Halobaculum sp. CBA1158 TaxID=2904243 RepID=UPI001F3425FD|nr:NAD(P)/FAD-dependent oxidoreductase [Halobaculum sp. CBA1158]UIP00700.1 NAD(P)/FAD-dependent oxidoreductase [Halobaculum sp. CBA1158]